MPGQWVPRSRLNGITVEVVVVRTGMRSNGRRAGSCGIRPMERKLFGVAGNEASHHDDRNISSSVCVDEDKTACFAWLVLCLLTVLSETIPCLSVL